MEVVKLILDKEELNQQFKLCCNKYDNLDAYIAWVGSPKNIFPFEYLKSLTKLNFYIGVDFNQTNPEGILLLQKLGANVRVIESRGVYHPKVYIFSNDKEYAIITGSSNFTYSGFFENFEFNILMKGNKKSRLICDFLSQLQAKIDQLNSFIPDSEWVELYEVLYNKRLNLIRNYKINDDTILEETMIRSSSWIETQDWGFYLSKIQKGMVLLNGDFIEGLNKKIEVFEEYEECLKLPWRATLFDSIENRRRLLGKMEYGWLGHVGASAKFQSLLANGTKNQKDVICKCINNIGEFELPINYEDLRFQLLKLIELGPTIKVWGRFLALVRPDLYCTISSNEVRRNLSKYLNKTVKHFESVDGYIDLLKIIHSSPWYNVAIPKKKTEKEIWKRRVAFLDIDFITN